MLCGREKLSLFSSTQGVSVRGVCVTVDLHIKLTGALGMRIRRYVRTDTSTFVRRYQTAFLIVNILPARLDDHRLKERKQAPVHCVGD